MRSPVRLAIPIALLALALAAGCASHKDPVASGLPTRTYRMGFGPNPPRPDIGAVLATIDLFSRRADQALILREPPWDSLLSGVRADTMVQRDVVELAAYLRAKGMRIVVSLDATDGLDRAADSRPLVAAGRSIAEPVIRQLFTNYAVALDTMIHPDWMGVGSETNLVRGAAPAAIYNGMRLAANEAGAAIRTVDPAARLFTTVQVDYAWLLNAASPDAAVAQDRTDFAFADGVGLSSYPYLLGWSDPDSLPLDYYSRLMRGDARPPFVIEGGWSSATVDTFVSSTDEQARYIRRHARILDQAGAIGWFQITFTDLDLSTFPPPFPSNLVLFAQLGLVDADLQPKPALAEWDAVYARPLSSP